MTEMTTFSTYSPCMGWKLTLSVAKQQYITY